MNFKPKHYRFHSENAFENVWDWHWDWDKFIQHNMTVYRSMISDLHDSSYALFSTNLISITNLHVGRPLLRPFLVAYAEATLARQQSATYEKCRHHFRIIVVNKWSVVWNEYKNRDFLFICWKSLWFLATWLVISDRYIGEVILQYLMEGMAIVTQIVPSHCPSWELNIFYSYHLHQQLVCFILGAVYN